MKHKGCPFDPQCCCFGKTLDTCTWNETVGKDYICAISLVWSLYLLSSLYVCRKPGLAEPETLKLGCSKWTKLVVVCYLLDVWIYNWMFKS